MHCNTDIIDTSDTTINFTHSEELYHHRRLLIESVNQHSHAFHAVCPTYYPTTHTLTLSHENKTPKTIHTIQEFHQFITDYIPNHLPYCIKIQYTYSPEIPININLYFRSNGHNHIEIDTDIAKYPGEKHNLRINAPILQPRNTIPSNTSFFEIFAPYVEQICHYYAWTDQKSLNIRQNKILYTQQMPLIPEKILFIRIERALCPHDNGIVSYLARMPNTQIQNQQGILLPLHASAEPIITDIIEHITQQYTTNIPHIINDSQHNLMQILRTLQQKTPQIIHNITNQIAKIDTLLTQHYTLHAP